MPCATASRSARLEHARAGTEVQIADQAAAFRTSPCKEDRCTDYQAASDAQHLDLRVKQAASEVCRTA